MRGYVDHVEGVVIVQVNNRAAVAIAVFRVLGSLKVVVNLEAIGVVALMMLGVERLEVRRKTLIEPDIGPVAPLHIVAKPVLAQLVRYEVRAGIILVGTLIVQCPIA
jgi:hypothetical protein